jgi:hypothetical protein
MSIQRLFQSATMNPAGGTAGSPSGVAGGLAAPAVPTGGLGTTSFPAVAAGGAILIRNNGTTVARLWFQDGQAAPALSPSQYLAEGGGTLKIPAGKFAIVETVVAGCGVAYTGGPISIVPGTQSYAILLDPPDHPAAAITI